MASLHRELRRLHRLQVDRILLAENGRRRLHRDAEDDRHSRSVTAEDPAVVVRARTHFAVPDDKRVIVLRTLQIARRKTVAELDALHTGDAENRLRDFAVESVEHRPAESHRNTLHLALDDSPDGIASLLRLLDVTTPDDLRRDGYAAALKILKAHAASRAIRRSQASGILATTRGNASEPHELRKISMTGTWNGPFRTIISWAHVLVEDVTATRPCPMDSIAFSAGSGELVTSWRAALHERGQLPVIDEETCRQSGQTEVNSLRV